MSDSARFALHRPEMTDALRRGDEKIAELMARHPCSFAGGTTLIETDAEHQFVYRLLRGWAGRVRTLADGRSQFILIFLPGDLFAVKSMFVTRHADATVALSNILAQQIDHRELHAACEGDRDVSLRCTWQVIEEERRLHNWVVGLGRGNAEERLAMLLLDFRARLMLSGVAAPGALEYEMPLTQEQLGDHLGITGVHVSRVLRTFREGDIVTVRGRKVRIGNLQALVEIAGPLLDTYERGSPAYGGQPDPACRGGVARSA